MDQKLITEIYKAGHSRIPIYGEHRDSVVGILYVKDLIKHKRNPKLTVKAVMRTEVHHVDWDDTLERVLEQFRQKRMHLFIVDDEFGGVAGIVTFEDVVEEIVGEVMDEYDTKRDMRK